jgi:hypothetical protein
VRLTYDNAGRKANLFATIGAGKPDGVIPRRGRAIRSAPRSRAASSTAAAALT